MSGAHSTGDPLALLGRQLLGRYTLAERVAQGGMSVIYRADDERLHRSVCVKIFSGLDRTTTYQTVYEHFIQEAFALSQLSHPNILRIYDFGYLDGGGAPFHVSEFMNGGTLHSLIQTRGPLSASGALDVLEPLVGALAEAHGRGIVHRDIKPTNILFGSAGKRRIVKLADFGIAKVHVEAMEFHHRAEDTRQSVGKRVSLFSPGWAAPEQLRGEAVGPTADVFALGLLIAYMLTGRKVFPDDNLLATVEGRREGDAYVDKILATLKLPDECTALIRRACSVDPRRRFPTVDAVLSALRQIPELLFEQVETNEFRREDVPRSRVVVDHLKGDELVAAGGRVRLFAVPDGAHADLTTGELRFRVTLLPAADGAARLHLKGLNCFVSRAGKRPSGAVDVHADDTIEILSNARKPAGSVRCHFGATHDGARLFPVAEASSLALPRELAPGAVLLDFGAGRELVLAFRAAGAPARVTRKGGHR
ncbi:MAG TPA: serine/threonine-protein kinase [Polyangia bacterium]|nr:serine/threonine-protein kinase [Polyangia bacterium]